MATAHNPEQASQQALLSRAGLGDRDAFRRFYDVTAPQVYALGLRMLGERARAEDLLQDVYLRAWHRAADYRADKGEPLAWLLSIARNRAIDMGRAAHLADLPLEGLEELVGHSAATEPGHDARLHRCIGQLDTGERQSVFCAYFHGQTHSEIARRLREPVGTIKTRIRRGLANLKRCLEG